MTYRTKLSLAFLASTALPLVGLAALLFREVERQVAARFEQRANDLAQVVRLDLRRESGSIRGRLERIEQGIRNDPESRLYRALKGDSRYRRILLDHAGTAMAVSGLDMLQIQDERGRILSSGHYRNEYDRLDPRTPSLLGRATNQSAFTWARSPQDDFLAIARVHTFDLTGERFYLVGGVEAKRALLGGVLPANEVTILIRLPDGSVLQDRSLELEAAGLAGARDTLVRSFIYPLIESTSGRATTLSQARIEVAYSIASLAELRRNMFFWFATIVAATLVLSLLLAAWLAGRVSRPVAELAAKAEVIDVDRLDVEFESDERDEFGNLSRLLAAMTRRLRVSLATLREAERRAAIGEIARQVNHDIKNGITPIRSVFRHLSQVLRDEPDRVAPLLQERVGTIDSSIAYLEELAANYARISARPERTACAVGPIIAEVAEAARSSGKGRVEVLGDSSAMVSAQPTELRRVLENLVGNAIDSLESPDAAVRITTEQLEADGQGPTLRITVADGGRGMSEAELERAFDDFFTTKPTGTGLGLSIVRRLVRDLGGSLRLDSRSGVGTEAIVELPLLTTHGRNEGGG